MWDSRSGLSAERSSVITACVQDGGVKLIVGLGNPGIEYHFSPHNVGFLAVDRIAANLGVEFETGSTGYLRRGR